MIAKNPAKPQGNFEIVLLKYGGYKIPGGYANTVEEEKLIDENDIEVYDWKSQEVKLTGTAQERLSKLRLEGKYFAVKINGDLIYSGTFLLISPQASLLGNYPKTEALNDSVIHLFKKGFFIIRPQHPPGIDIEYNNFPKEGKEIIENKQVKAFFQKLGKLNS